MNYIYIKKCDKVNLFLIIMQKYSQKDKILLTLVEELAKNTSFKLALDITLKKFKISSNEKKKIFDQFKTEGLKLLNIELNKLVNKLLKEKKKPNNFKKFKINEKVNYFIVERIRIIDNLVDIRRLFKINKKNKSLLNLFKILFNISDEIWFLTGDKSTDFNFYSKRFILMNIYFLSIIYFSKNLDMKLLQNFVDKQIKAVLLFGNFKRKLKNSFIPK